MPRILNPEIVRELFVSAGFIPDNEFHYKNNKTKVRVFDILHNKYVEISAQQLKYNIKSGKRPLWEAPKISDENIPSTNDVIERLYRRHENFSDLPEAIQQSTFRDYKLIRRNLNNKQNFTFAFDQNPETQSSQMRAVVMGLKDSLPKILRTHKILAKITTAEGLERYFHINGTTLDDLYAIFKNVEPDFSVEDSSSNFGFSNMSLSTIDFTLKPRENGRQVAAGFFPYVNLGTEDLSRYGIYKENEITRAAEPCLITAFKASNIFSESEINQLIEMVNTRCFPQVFLKNIAEHFNINIYVRKYFDNGKTSHVEFNTSGTRSLKLMILEDHFMLYEIVDKKSTFSIVKHANLRPFTNNEFEKVFREIIFPKNPIKNSIYNSARPIKRTDPAPKPMSPEYRSKLRHGKHLFGYEPDESEVEMRLNELQEFINEIPTRKSINVRKYYKFSSLMQRLMYEFGCFDNVFELSGNLRDEIRNNLVFPKRELYTNEINEKCYYVDFNGAYCSFMTHIPIGPKPNPESPKNSKVKELIRLMYNKRVEVKTTNPKLAKTIKFIMCSCYGESIKKPKIIKHKYSNNIDGTIRNLGDFVLSHPNASEGFVDSINPYVEHYSHPHFAKVILDGFNNKVNEIKSLVNVLFQNIDAFMITESDYKKLEKLGFIHPTELGKLKVEHVFTKVKFYNKMKWEAVCEDGSVFKHCM